MSDYSKSALTQFENTGYSKIFTILNFIPWNTFSFASFIDVFKPGKAREQLKSEQACEGGGRESTGAVQLTAELPPSRSHRPAPLLGKDTAISCTCFNLQPVWCASKLSSRFCDVMYLWRMTRAPWIQFHRVLTTHATPRGFNLLTACRSEQSVLPLTTQWSH